MNWIEILDDFPEPALRIIFSLLVNDDNNDNNNDNKGFLLDVLVDAFPKLQSMVSSNKKGVLWDKFRKAPRIMRGHTDLVKSVAWSPDGLKIVSASADHTLRIWNAVTGSPIDEPLKGHTHWVQSVAWSPDGQKIVSGSDDGTLRIWNAWLPPITGRACSTHSHMECGQPLKGHTDWVMRVAWNPDGQKIVSGSYDQTVCIWNAITGEQIGKPLKGNIGSVRSMAWSPDGQKIAYGSYNNTVQIWIVSDLERENLVEL